MLKDLKNAANYIFLEMSRVTEKDFDEIKSILIDKASKDVKIKFIYDSPLKLKIKKELKKAGIRIKRFSKYNAIGGNYSNLRNETNIDQNKSFQYHDGTTDPLEGLSLSLKDKQL